MRGIIDSRKQRLTVRQSLELKPWLSARSPLSDGHRFERLLNTGKSCYRKQHLIIQKQDSIDFIFDSQNYRWILSLINGFVTPVQSKSAVLASIHRQKAHTSLIDRHLVHTPETTSDVIEVVGRLCRPEVLADVIAEVTPRRNKLLVSDICGAFVLFAARLSVVTRNSCERSKTNQESLYKLRF